MCSCIGDEDEHFSSDTDILSESGSVDVNDDHAPLCYIENICEEIYYNDLVMLNIIKYVPYKKRENLELTSRRMYYLCSQVPYTTNDTLHLQVFEHNITLKRKSRLNDISGDMKGVGNPHKTEDPYNILLKYSKKFKRDIKRIRFFKPLNAEYLKLVNDHFMYTTELYCGGFTDDGVEYLRSANQKLTQRITELGFLLVFHVPDKNHIFYDFRNLRKLYLAGQYNTYCMEEYDKLTRKIPVITIETGKLKPQLLEISTKCESFEVFYRESSTFRSFAPIYPLENLSFLDVNLRNLNEKDLIKFFANLNLHRLQKARIAKVYYTDNVLRLLCPITPSKLTEFEILNWIGDRSNRLHLATIFPKSLRKLYIISTIVATADIDLIPKVCPLLDVFCLEMKREFRRDQGSLWNLVFQLEHLEHFVTDMIFRGDFVEKIFYTKTKLLTAKFRLTAIKFERFYKILKKLYGPSEYFQKFSINQNMTYVVSLDLPVDPELLKVVDISRIRLI